MMIGLSSVKWLLVAPSLVADRAIGMRFTNRAL
jgi:hypothetical protein